MLFSVYLKSFQIGALQFYTELIIENVFLLISPGLLSSMPKKEQRAQPFGLHLGENRTSPARKFPLRLSGILTCSPFPSTEVIKIKTSIMRVKASNRVIFVVDILAYFNFLILLFMCLHGSSGKFQVRI